MLKKLGLFIVFLTLSFAQVKNECIVCHEGIKEIRDHNSGMMQAIFQKADENTALA